MQGCGNFNIFLKVIGFMGMAYAQLRFVNINLIEDGSVAVNSRIPACESGGRIHIMSYSYLNRECGTTCINEPVGKLSTEAEIHIHEMCSFKEKCSNMRFPSADLQHQHINTVGIEYKCEDLNDTFIDMCDNAATLFTKDTHLVATVKTKLFKECRCVINSCGKLEISITDLRLQSKSRRNCSSTAVHINSQHYVCSKPDYGAIFNRNIEESLSTTFISLTSGFDNLSPQMIWLSLRPKGPKVCTIYCVNISRDTSTTRSTTFSSNTFADVSNLTRQSESLNLSCSNMPRVLEPITTPSMSRPLNSVEGRGESVPFSTYTIVISSSALLVVFVVIIVGVTVYHRLKSVRIKAIGKAKDELERPSGTATNAQETNIELLQPQTTTNTTPFRVSSSHYEEPSNERIASSAAGGSNVTDGHYAVPDSENIAASLVETDSCYEGLERQQRYGSTEYTPLNYGDLSHQMSHTAHPANDDIPNLASMARDNYEKLNQELRFQDNDYAPLNSDVLTIENQYVADASRNPTVGTINRDAVDGNYEAMTGSNHNDEQDYLHPAPVNNSDK